MTNHSLQPYKLKHDLYSSFIKKRKPMSKIISSFKSRNVLQQQLEFVRMYISLYNPLLLRKLPICSLPKSSFLNLKNFIDSLRDCCCLYSVIMDNHTIIVFRIVVYFQFRFSVTCIVVHVIFNDRNIIVDVVNL